MALVEEDPVDDSLNRLLHRSVVEHDVGGLAAELEGELLLRARGRAGDSAAHGGRPGEGDLVDPGVIHQQLAGPSRAGEDVDHPVREVGLLQNLGEEQRGEGRRFGGLQHNRVSCGEGGSDFPGEHQQRKVPRNHLGRNSESAGCRPQPRVVELVGPARVIEEPGCDERDVDIPTLSDRFAVIEALGDSELPCTFLHEAGDAEEVFAAIGAAQLRPGAVVGSAGGGDGGVDIRFVRARNCRDVLLGGR